MAASAPSGCHVCAMLADDTRVVHCDGGLRVLTVPDRPGWLMLATQEHGDWLFDLDDQDAGALGRVLRDAARTVRELTGSDRVYYVGLGENSSHVHGLLTARQPGLGGDIQQALVARGAELADATAGASFAAAAREMLASLSK